MDNNQEPRTLQERKEQEYRKHVEEVTPKYNTLWRMTKAFFVGGAFCILGQWIMNMGMNTFGLEKEIAGNWCSMLLVLLSALLTGLNIYPRLAQWSGAGSLVPITGFANSVASAAIEYSKEGQVFGIGCKIFNIAGPVILYGIFTSWVLGVIYWIVTSVI